MKRSPWLHWVVIAVMCCLLLLEPTGWQRWLWPCAAAGVLVYLGCWRSWSRRAGWADGHRMAVDTPECSRIVARRASPSDFSVSYAWQFTVGVSTSGDDRGVQTGVKCKAWVGIQKLEVR